MFVIDVVKIPSDIQNFVDENVVEESWQVFYLIHILKSSYFLTSY